MDRYNYPREKDKYSHTSNPSFSSTLLDSIYRSIDQGEEEQALYRDSFKRASMIEKWMEHKVSEKTIVRRKSAENLGRNSRNLNSSSSSSDSSCGGVFSSSEADSVYGVYSASSCYGLNRPKPIRTHISTHPEKINKPHVKDLHNHANYTQNRQIMERDFAPSQQKPKREGGFVKTKSKALKIYGDLKKVKQPISPGGRLASFLNSLFTTGNAKKSKVSSNSVEDRQLKSANTSTCSSASSFSRSCLSKSTPSSRNNKSSTKRSVRFYPVSIIVDEDSKPCGHKNLYEDQPVKIIDNSINDQELRFHAMEKNRRVEEAAKDLLKNYQKKAERDFDMRQAYIKKMEVFDNEEEEEDDSASCASSDLFELDNLSVNGMEMYCEELPVYETTHLHTNRAIANGLIL